MVKSNGFREVPLDFYLLVNSEIHILEKNLFVLKTKGLTLTNFNQEACICRQMKQTVVEQKSP
jgi:GTP-sensing pleiotropic transcriptional regulator CodY